MSLTRINHNTMAMNAQRNLNINTGRVAQSMERLSSGLRINRASDDPSGLVLSESLRADVSGLDIVEQNVAEGINLIKTAEGALQEINALLRQMNDLALDAASTSNNTADTRESLQTQAESAITTINAITANTKYGGLNLLDGSAGTSANLLDTTNVNSLSLTSTAGAGYVEVDVTTAATKAAHAGTNTYATVGTTVDNTGSITINGVSIGTFTNGVDDVQAVIDAINTKTTDTGVSAAWDTDHVALAQTGYGTTNGIVLTETADVINGAATAVEWGIDAVATTTWGDATTSTMDQGTGIALADSDGNAITLTSAGNTVATHSDVAYVTQGSVSFQAGLTAAETSSTSIASVSAADLGTTDSVANVDLSSVAGAQAALTVLAEAINEVSMLRSALGAFQTNELESQGRSLAVTRENLAASESAIRDTDFGAEMAEFSTSQILVQSATSFLAQANNLPQNILTLMR